MNLHWLQHVPFEGLGSMEPWLAENDHVVTRTRLWAGEKVPDTETVEGLIVMGGPMGVGDDEQHPWLPAEKTFIKEIIAQNKPVLGICLGAQLIAEVLGAKVWPVRRSLGEGGKNGQKEIGFFPVSGRKAAERWKLPEEFLAFHWHGDTFDIPDGAVCLASSEACENQAFVYNDNVLALQFHLETTEESLRMLYENCAEDVDESPFCQRMEEMSLFFSRLGEANSLMFGLLKYLF